ncbi:MAG TPA: VWA domain-containing protein, partial [Beutenbergiaceae bacterium]|nr:VWA domain-containing protein [Beutenbergiaceae bacterium]
MKHRHSHEGPSRAALWGILATGGLMAGSLVGLAAPANADVNEDADDQDDGSLVDDEDSDQGTNDGADRQDDAGESDELAPTMLILDASGSMAADDGDSSGMTRMEAAQQAVGELAGGVPDRAALGLVVYGANVSSAPEDQEEGCEDIEVLASPQVGQADQIANTVTSIEASGYTPIGESLRAADGELPDNGERSIILVSDGIDTCAPPPPCEVAAELNEAGADLRLHAIGFKVDDEARADLECIAEEGGGTYADAENADELAEEMARAAMRGMRGYEIAGEPIEGGTTPMQATEIDPGDYVDVLAEGGSGLAGSGGAEKYYRIPLEQGERLHVTATMIGPDGTRSIWAGGPMDNARLNLGMITDEEDDCEAIGDNSGTTLNMNDGLIAWGVSEPLGSADCQGSEILFGIERAGSLMADEPFDVELLVRTEPADMDDSQMPPPANEVNEEALISSIEVDDGDSELFGTSFADATPIEPGTYSARVVTGERNFVRVPVSYGQTMRFAVEIEDGPDDSDELGFSMDDVGRFGAVVVNPLRQPVPLWDGEELTEGVRTPTSIGNGIAANMATEVNFANRD